MSIYKSKNPKFDQERQVDIMDLHPPRVLVDTLKNNTSVISSSKFINSFDISTENIPIKGTTRFFTVRGTEGARYFINVVRNTDNKRYNFNTNTFVTETGIVEKTIGSSGVDTGFISFPSQSASCNYVVSIDKLGDTVNNVEKITEEARLDGVNSKTVTVFGKKIYQWVDLTMTFSLKSANGHWATFPSNVTITKPRDFINSGRIDKSGRFSIDWTVTMSSGNGMVISRQPVESDFEVQKTTTVSETNADASTDIKVASNEKIPIGSAVTGTDIGTDGQSATSAVASIKTVSGEQMIVLSNTQTVVAGRTLTFTFGGSDASSTITGAKYTIESASVELNDVTTAVNGAVSGSANVTVDSSDGIIASSTTYVSGIGVVGSGCTTTTRRPHVDAINTSTNVMTLSDAQTLPDNTSLTIKGSSRVAKIKIVGTITDIGTSNTTLTLDLDNFLTQS